MKDLNSWFVTCWGFVFVFCFSKMQIYKKNKKLEHFLGLENIHFKSVEWSFFGSKTTFFHSAVFSVVPNLHKAICPLYSL